MVNVDQLPKACVILGAGASHDVWNGSESFQEAWKPPLARDLFDIEHHPDYSTLLAPYSSAKTLVDVLASRLTSPNFNLEAELRAFSEHPDARVSQHFKYVPPYLRDLLWRSSYQYTRPGTYGAFLHELLAEVPHHVLFLVLNYDTLLEQALTLLDPQMDFTNIESYVRGDRQAKVVKLHGSINWFKLIGSSSQTWEALVNSQDVFQKTPENAIYIHDTPGPLMSVFITDNRPYPVLTAPLAGKGVAEMVCPNTHLEVARDFLADCRKFLIVGTSGLDEDLLSFLDAALSGTSQPVCIHVVDANHSFRTLRRFQDRVGAFQTFVRLPGGITYGAGFRRYVSEQQFQTFAKALLQS